MAKKNYTYQEALNLIKREITKTKSSKLIRKKKEEHEPTIREFCSIHGLNYPVVVNALNSKTESHPTIIKEMLAILLEKNIKHHKLNIFSIE